MKNKICTSLEQSQKLMDYEKAQRLSNSKTLKQNVRSRRIVNEYWADGEWHYEYKVE